MQTFWHAAAFYTAGLLLVPDPRTPSLRPLETPPNWQRTSAQCLIWHFAEFLPDGLALFVRDLLPRKQALRVGLAQVLADIGVGKDIVVVLLAC